MEGNPDAAPPADSTPRTGQGQKLGSPEAAAEAEQARIRQELEDALGEVSRMSESDLDATADALEARQTNSELNDPLNTGEPSRRPATEAENAALQDAAENLP